MVALRLFAHVEFTSRNMFDVCHWIEKRKKEITRSTARKANARSVSLLRSNADRIVSSRGSTAGRCHAANRDREATR
jgi:hypothetical protein